jgi:hypothetical protein
VIFYKIKAALLFSFDAKIFSNPVWPVKSFGVILSNKPGTVSWELFHNFALQNGSPPLCAFKSL